LFWADAMPVNTNTSEEERMQAQHNSPKKPRRNIYSSSLELLE
jgi:hypothetical protein